MGTARQEGAVRELTVRKARPSKTSGLAMSFFGNLWKRAGAAYRAKVGKELSAHGLMYEDCLIETENVKLALKRLPKEILIAREQRLKRAMFLSSQHKSLPPEIAEKLDPWESYLNPPLEAIKKEKQELLAAK